MTTATTSFPIVSTRLNAQFRTGDRYIAWLGWLLLGYALLGRGAAYFGVAPLYVGEVMMLLGLFALVSTKSAGAALRSPLLRLLVAFMAWGAMCTVPYLGTYGVFAVRDAALWGYGSYAIIVAALLIHDPSRLRDLLLRYRRFVVIFGSLAWLLLVLKGYGRLLPAVPGSTVPIVQVKSGDTLVHVAGASAFILVGLARPRAVVVGLLALAPLLGNRAGMLSCAIGLLVAGSLSPFPGKPVRLLYLGCCALVLLALFTPTVTVGSRSVSSELLWTKAESIFSESESSRYNNTRGWRLEWWTKIVGYTVNGPYFWTGKGYGINLSVDDGFKSGAGEALRSPHNSHMTVLARSGVPGFVLWLLLQGGWLYCMLVYYARSRQRGNAAWTAVFAFLISYWIALMINACFDVVLEGPMGGIWMWSLFGVGVASTYIYKHHPEVF